MLNIASENNHLINTCPLFFSRAEELETELMKMVKQDNQWQLSARVEQLRQELAELKQVLADKRVE